MKTITILLTILITFASCKCQKKTIENSTETSTNSQKVAMDVKYVYEANTRGYFQKIVIENQQVFVVSDRNSKELGTGTKIKDSDFKELNNYLNSIKLDDLATYKDPTQKRFYDGAAIANLKIISNGKEYTTMSFDNGFPPIEIEKLVNKITSFVKKE